MEIPRSTGRTSHHPATGSHSPVAQPRDPRADCQHRPQAPGVLLRKQGRDGSGTCLKRSRPRGQPSKIGYQKNQGISFYMCIRGAAEVRLSHLSNRARHLRAGNAACNSTRGMSGSGSISSASSAQNATNGSSLPLPLPGPTAGAPEACHRAPSSPRRGVVAGPGSKGRPAAAAHNTNYRNHCLG